MSVNLTQTVPFSICSGAAFLLISNERAFSGFDAIVRWEW